MMLENKIPKIVGNSLKGVGHIKSFLTFLFTELFQR